MDLTEPRSEPTGRLSGSSPARLRQPPEGALPGRTLRSLRDFEPPSARDPPGGYPGFTFVLLALLSTMDLTGRRGIHVQREVLIGFDLRLAVILGLLLYAVSARDPLAPTGAFDALQLVLVDLAVSAWLYARFIRRRGPFHSLERWQTSYLPVFACWAGLIVVVFPLVFGF